MKTKMVIAVRKDLNMRKGKIAAGPIVECPHCGKIGTNNAMRRWHFDNCKEKNSE